MPIFNQKYLKKFNSEHDRGRRKQPVCLGRELMTDTQPHSVMTELLKMEYRKEIECAAIEGYLEVFEMASKAVDYYPGAIEEFAAIVEAVRQCVVETIIIERSF